MQNELTAERIEMAIAYWAEFYQEIGEMQNGLSGGQYELLEEQREPVITALAALRAEQERNKGCEWCNTELRFECYLIDDDGYTASIENNVVQTIIADYCPACGRRLTEGSENND